MWSQNCGVLFASSHINASTSLKLSGNYIYHLPWLHFVHGQSVFVSCVSQNKLELFPYTMDCFHGDRLRFLCGTD